MFTDLKNRKDDGQKWALVTGATVGIGMAYCQELAKRGINLFLVSRTEKDLVDLCAKLRLDFGIDAVFYPCDLGSESHLVALVEKLKKEKIKIRILINNAGTQLWGTFIGFKFEKHFEMIHLNFIAPLRLGMLFAQELRDPDFPCVLINVCSQSSYQPMPYLATYAASKSALLSLSLALHQELKEQFGVYVQTVIPDFTRSRGSMNDLLLAHALGLKTAKEPSDIVLRSLNEISNQTPVVTNIRFLSFHRILMGLLSYRFLLRILSRKLKPKLTIRNESNLVATK